MKWTLHGDINVSFLHTSKNHTYNLFFNMVCWCEKVGLAKNSKQPLLLQQRQAIRIYLKKQNLVGSTAYHIKLLGILPVDSLYKNKVIFIKKNYDLCVNVNF